MEVPNKKRKLQVKWSENDKLQIFKLIKQEYELLLKNNEHVSRSWSTVIKRIVQKGAVEYDEIHLTYVWNRMKQSLMLHENTPNMTDLDWKVWRLLRRSKKISVINESSKNKTSSSNSSYPTRCDFISTGKLFK